MPIRRGSSEAMVLLRVLRANSPYVGFGGRRRKDAAARQVHPGRASAISLGKINLVLDRDLFEIADENFNAGPPAAGNRQPNPVDPPDRRFHVVGMQAQRLDSGVGLEENKRHFFRSQRTELAIEE